MYFFFSFDDGEKKKEDPVETKDGLAKQLGEKVTGYVYDLASEIGLDSFVSKDLLDKILQPLITDTVQTLLDATGLDTLLGTGTLSDKYDAAKGLLLDEEKGLIALPEKLIQPMLSAMEEAEMLGTMTQDEIEDMLVNVKDEFVKLIPLRRGASVEEVASVALFLGSDLSSYVSGQVIAVNGGMYC